MTMVERQGGGGVVGAPPVDVLSRLHQLRRTLQECHHRVERVDCQFHALHTTHHPGGGVFFPNHPGLYTTGEPLQMPQEERLITGEELPERKENGTREETTKEARQKKDSMSEVKEAEEHLLQTEWTVVVGELTEETFELTHDEAEEEEEEEEETKEEEEEEEVKNSIEDGASSATNRQPSEARKRPSLTRQDNIDIEDDDPKCSINLLNNFRPKYNCDGDHAEEGHLFRYYSCPDLLDLYDRDVNEIYSNEAIELWQEMNHSDDEKFHKPSKASVRGDDHSYVGHCNGEQHDPRLPQDVAHSLDVLQETLELMKDHFNFLKDALGDSPEQLDHHRPRTSKKIPSKVVEMFDCPSLKTNKDLREDCKATSDGERTSTELPDQDTKELRSPEGQERTTQVISTTCPGKPESQSVARVHQQYSNVIYERGRKQDFRDYLSTVLLVLLVMLALLFLACCLLLVVPVVTVSVRTKGGPHVF